MTEEERAQDDQFEEPAEAERDLEPSDEDAEDVKGGTWDLKQNKSV